MKESHKRSVIKGVTWRVIASLTTFILVYIFTGDIAVTLGVSAIEVSAKILFYYFHERFWGKVHWGMLGVEPRIPQTNPSQRKQSKQRSTPPTRKLAVAKRRI